MKKNIFYIIILLFLLFLFITNTNLLIESTNNSIINFKNNLLPTLFPIFIISDLLINYNFPIIINNIFYKTFYKLFKIDRNSCFIIILGLLTGYSNTFNIILNLYDKKLIDTKSINKIILFTNFINPLYLISILSVILNIKIALYILLTTYISNIIIGIMYRNYNISKNNIEINNTDTFFNCLIFSIKKNINSLLVILGINIFTCIISNIIFNNSLIGILFKGLIDFTNGLSIISNLTIKTKIIFSIIFISFGGINAHLQCINLLHDIDYTKYLKARILQIIISLLIVLPLLMIY